MDERVAPHDMCVYTNSLLTPTTSLFNHCNPKKRREKIHRLEIGSECLPKYSATSPKTDEEMSIFSTIRLESRHWVSQICTRQKWRERVPPYVRTNRPPKTKKISPMNLPQRSANPHSSYLHPLPEDTSHAYSGFVITIVPSFLTQICHPRAHSGYCCCCSHRPRDQGAGR